MSKPICKAEAKWDVWSYKDFSRYGKRFMKVARRRYMDREMFDEWKAWSLSRALP